MPKYFIKTPISADVDGDGERYIHVEGDLAHHLLHVLRMKKGDSLTLCDGRSMDYDCVIIHTMPKETSLSLAIKASRVCDTEPGTRVILYQALPKGDKMDWIVQKCVELGVHAIVPVVTKHSVVRVNKDWRTKTERYQRIAEAAASQSQRGMIPIVAAPVSFEEALASSQVDMHLFAYENERTRTITQALRGLHPASIALWIGPEGGFSEDEAAYFGCINYASAAVTLGRRILRTETAGMAALIQIWCVLEEI